jgi:hypothetical protein
LDEPSFAVFAVLSSELSASEASTSAEILGCGRSGAKKNSKPPAVPPLFFAVVVPRKQRHRKHRIYAVFKYLRGNTLPNGQVFVNKINILPMLLLPTTGLIRLVGNTGP